MINLIYNGGMVPNLVPCYANAKNNKIYCENVIEYKSFIIESQSLNGSYINVVKILLCQSKKF